MPVSSHSSRESVPRLEGNSPDNLKLGTDTAMGQNKQFAHHSHLPLAPNSRRSLKDS